ncbi:MAG: terminase [Acidobacteria bacterium]|nr:terminase [Acidobacteriota bacterium]
MLAELALAGSSVLFRGASLEAQAITAHEWIVAGPAETGKTFALMHRLAGILEGTPRASGALVRKVRTDMTGNVLVTWQRVIDARGGWSAYGGEEPKWFDHTNGSRLYIGGMDRPGKVLSGERDVICVNQAEELHLEDWETLSTRCTGRGAVVEYPMLFGDCNPGPPSHWILSRPSLKVLHSRHEDNPTLYDEQGNLTPQGVRTMAVLDALTGVRRERLRFGRWVSAEGVVYDLFDLGAHVIPRLEIPASWPRYRVHDFGFTNPYVCQWWARDDDGRLYRYREIYRTQRLVEDHAKQIKALSVGERIVADVCDHDAEGRATLEKYLGIRTTAARKDVLSGIEAVKSRLRPAGDGKPRMFFLVDSLVERDPSLVAAHLPVCTEEEMGVYVWALGPDGRPRVKEAPVKENDHGLDATRYLVQHVDKPMLEVKSFQG